MAQQAGQALSTARGISYTGTISDDPARMSVTRAGTVEGTITTGQPISRITIGGVTYLKAPASFWIGDDLGATAAQQAGGHWAKAPDLDAGLSFASLTPGRIAAVLRATGPSPHVSDSTVHGQQVIVLTEHGTTYYITRSQPNRLVAVAGGQASGNPYTLSANPLDTATAAPVFAALHADVADLQGAPDPGATVSLNHQLKFVNCSTASVCQVAGSASVTDPGAPAVLLKMSVGFSGTKNGTPFTTCATEVTVTSTASVSPSCSVQGSVWSNWFNGHNGNFFVYANAQFDPLVNTASDVTALQNEVTREQNGG
jgi:hypothetical protein